MPEEYEGQHLTIARRLCNSKEDTVLLDGLKIKFFLLSNNFTFQKYDSSGDISPENVEAYDELMIGLVKKVGLNSVNDFKLLLSNGRTAEAVAEQLFASAIRSGQLEIVKMMLEAGMNPNSSMDSIISNSLLTALEYATGCYRKATSIRMTGAYLSQQTIDQLEVDEEKDLDDTAKKKHIELMNILIAAGAHATPISLHFAIVSGDAILMQILLDAGADVNGRAYIKSGADKDLTALGRAICQRNVRIAQILIANGANVDQLQRHNESPLDLAAMKGDVSMLELLLDSHANVNPPLLRHSLFLSPLDRAVSFCPKNSEAWKLLLNAGANICSADGRLEARLLVSAVSEGNTELCGILLAHGAKVYLNEAGLRHYSKPLLLFAAESGNVGTLSILLSHGAHVNAVGVRDGKTALGTAIEFGNCEMIHILWQAGATIIGNIDRIGNTETANILARTGLLPDVVWQHGSKMLADAIWEDNQDLIRSILSYEMHFDASSGVLEAAILVGSMELVEDLIRRGAKFTVRSLHATVYKALGTGDDSIVRRFLGFYSELSHVDHADSTAIAMVIQKGNLNLLQLLLEAGIDPRGALPKGYDFTNGKRHCINWRTPYYWDYSPEYASSVLEVAAKKGDQSFLRVLLTATTWDQESAGFALTVAIENSNYHLVEDLLEIGADLDVDVPLDNLTLNSLQLAIEAQQIPLICTLLQAGANINHLGSGDFSRTALQAAVETGNLELLDLLLDAGGNVNSPPAAIGGATALQIAACKGFLAITRKLLSAGAKINAKKARVDGRTALEGAAEHGRIDMLYLLLNEGASIQNRGRTQYIRAVKFAETSGHYAAAKLLKSVGGWTESDKLQYDKEDISDKFGAEGWRRDYGTADQFSSEDISDSDSEIVGNSTNDDMMESINEVWDEFTEGFGGFTESSDWLTAEGLAEF
jgi:ankyrin repeat protein